MAGAWRWWLFSGRPGGSVEIPARRTDARPRRLASSVGVRVRRDSGRYWTVNRTTLEAPSKFPVEPSASATESNVVPWIAATRAAGKLYGRFG